MGGMVSAAVRSDAGGRHAGVAGEAGGRVSESPVTRREAVARVEEWWEAVQRSQIGGEHPLASVQALHLSEAEAGPHRHYGKETRRSGQSRPLIRDLPGGVRRMDNIMGDIERIDRRYYRALWFLAENRGLVTEVASMMKVSRPTAMRYVDCGIGMVQIALLRGNQL